MEPTGKIKVFVSIPLAEDDEGNVMFTVTPRVTIYGESTIPATLDVERGGHYPYTDWNSGGWAEKDAIEVK